MLHISLPVHTDDFMSDWLDPTASTKVSTACKTSPVDQSCPRPGQVEGHPVQRGEPDPCVGPFGEYERNKSEKGESGAEVFEAWLPQTRTAAAKATPSAYVRETRASRAPSCSAASHARPRSSTRKLPPGRCRRPMSSSASSSPAPWPRALATASLAAKRPAALRRVPVVLSCSAMSARSPFEKLRSRKLTSRSSRTGSAAMPMERAGPATPAAACVIARAAAALRFESSPEARLGRASPTAPTAGTGAAWV
mmetsp:Transcript_107310/g.260500  ORF Transcript_107310/g.260500 Transcript_107310/m.260500 type:complete len:252 (-) Transcript_107310:3044-3799(-)